MVWGAAKVMNPKGTGASSLFQSIDGLGNSGSVALLEQERATLIAMTAAPKTLTVAAKPAMADPDADPGGAELEHVDARAQTTGGTGVTTLAPPANPTAAEATGKSDARELRLRHGDPVALPVRPVAARERLERVRGEPASGAYGIPQSLPGDKMATAGSDWQTNPATQINWGLGYIKSVYGTPCGAWQNEVNYGYY